MAGSASGAGTRIMYTHSLSRSAEARRRLPGGGEVEKRKRGDNERFKPFAPDLCGPSERESMIENERAEGRGPKRALHFRLVGGGGGAQLVRGDSLGRLELPRQRQEPLPQPRDLRAHVLVFPQLRRGELARLGGVERPCSEREKSLKTLNRTSTTRRTLPLTHRVEKSKPRLLPQMATHP